MKLIKFFYLILVFNLFKCTDNGPRLLYYKIDDFYINTYKLNVVYPPVRNLVESMIFSKGDSVFIGLSFKISYCDSAAQVFEYHWQPTRGGHGIAKLIKNFFILSKTEKRYDTISMLDMRLIKDSFNYIVKKDRDVQARANPVDRPDCQMSLEEFIRTINRGSRCFVNNDLNSAHFLYYLNTQRLAAGNNDLEFCFEFSDYVLKKKISIRVDSN